MRKILLLFCALLLMSTSFVFAQGPVLMTLPAPDLTSNPDQEGWSANSFLNVFGSAKYLVIETEGAIGDNAGGFGGLDFVVQGNAVSWIATQTSLWGGWINYDRSKAGSIISIAIDINNVLGPTNLANFLSCTGWAQIVLCYYGGATA